MIEQLKEGRIVRLELKYCEGCGGLLLRRSGDSVVYCASCTSAFSEMPVLEKRESRGSGSGTVVPRKPPQSVRIEASARRLG